MAGIGDAVAPSSSAQDAQLRASIVRLARSASIETSARNLAEIDGYAARLPPGADVFATLTRW